MATNFFSEISYWVPNELKCQIWCNSIPWLLSYDTIPGETRRDDKTTRRKTENRANSVQLQVQLPTGTELGNSPNIIRQLVIQR